MRLSGMVQNLSQELKSDLGGIEMNVGLRKRLERLMLKSDLGGIEIDSHHFTGEMHKNVKIRPWRD